MVVIEDLVAQQVDLEARRPALAAEVAEIEAEQEQLAWEENASPDRGAVVRDAARSQRHSDLEARRRHAAAALFKVDHRLRWIGERLGEADQAAALAERNRWLDDLDDPQVRMLAERVRALESLTDRIIRSLVSRGLPVEE